MNIFVKKSAPDVLQACITQSQNPRQYFPVVFCLASRGPFHNYIDLIWWHNVWHFPFAFKFCDKYFTFTDNALEFKINLEKYTFYMHYSAYSKLSAARIFADICQYFFHCGSAGLREHKFYIHLIFIFSTTGVRDCGSTSSLHKLIFFFFLHTWMINVMTGGAGD